MNYYEILGLKCDPVENNVGKIKAALDEWRNKTLIALNDNSSSQLMRQQLNEQKAAEDDMKRLLTDANLRTQHAEELKTRRLTQLESIIQVMIECSGTTPRCILNARVGKIAGEVGLSLATVKKVFQSKPYEYSVELKAVVNTNELFLLDSHWNTLHSYFAELKKYMQSNPTDPLHAMVNISDIYGYISVMETGSASSADKYKDELTETLFGIMENLQTTHVANTMPKRVFKQIELHVNANILSDNNQRSKYNNRVLIQNMKPFFDTLTLVPVSVKLEHQFAQGCIKRIMKTFPTRDHAIAIYNKFGNLPSDSIYEEESTMVSTVCAICNKVHDYEALEQAQAAVCNCGARLYINCPSCGKYAPAIASYCTCGFFIKGMRSFEKHFVMCEDAIKGMNLDKAKLELNTAKLCNPGEPRLIKLQDSVKALEEALGKPIREIEALISARRISTALKNVTDLKTKRPGVDLRHYEQTIKAELAWAQSEFGKFQKIASLEQRIEYCLNIINRISDYEPALDEIIRNKPSPPVNVHSTKDVQGLTCTLQWEPNPHNRDVTYTVVRRESAIPQNIEDGVSLVEGLKVTVFKDINLTPGKLFAYAVFSVRTVCALSISAPAPLKEGVCLLKDLTGVRVDINGQNCTLSWNDIPGSLGVRIQRSEDDGKQWGVLSERAQGFFSDKNIGNDKQYRYRLQTVWDVNHKQCVSAGIMRNVKIEEKPDPPEIYLGSISSEGTCELTWSMKTGSGMMQIIALNDSVNVKKNSVYERGQLKEMGEIITAAVPVANGSYTYRIGVSKRVRVAAFCPFGDNAVAGNTVLISTIPSVIIDTENTVVAGNKLQLVIKDIPTSVTRLYYSVSTSTANPYASEELALKGDMLSIDVSVYRREGMIVVDKLPQQELFLTLIAMYGTGDNRYFSPPAKTQLSNLPKVKVEYWIEWPTAGALWNRHFVRDGAKLYIHTEGTRIPTAVLCCRHDGKMLFKYSPGSPDIVKIAEIPTESVSRGETKVYDLDAYKMRGIPKDTDIQLFLEADEAKQYYQPTSTIISSRKMPPET